MAKNLTAAAVAKFKAGHKRREIADGGAPGLRLVIQPSGAKSWCMRFRSPTGKSAKLTLGKVNTDKKAPSEPVLGAPLSLAAARKLAADLQHQRARDADIIADHKAAKLRRRAESEVRAASTFAAAAKDFIQQHAMKKTRRWQEQARLLGLNPKKDLEIISGGLAHRWRDRAIAAIDGHDIFGVVDETRRRGAPGLERRSDGETDSRARAMLNTLSKMFSWLVQHRRVDKNPCDGVHRPETPQARDRVLSDAEIVTFWRAADGVGEPFGQLLKLLLLTGCRLNEVAGMRRAELSEDGTTWTLPKERTKNKRPHVVPLPPLARDLLDSVKRIESRAGLMFTTTGETPVSGWSRVKGRLDEAMKAPLWRLHDLRRTAATGMAGLGVAPHIVEAALNHVSGVRAGVAGVYNRALYTAEKKAAAERWASHVEGLVAGRKAKVVPMRGKGA